MKLFEIWFILWSLKFCFEISINWFMAFFLMLMRKDLTEIVFGHSAGIS